MDALTHAKMRRAVMANEIAHQEKYLDRADGPAYEQCKRSITVLSETISLLDEEIEELTEAELFKQDREAAINRAVQISQLKMIQSMLDCYWLASSNETGMTVERYVSISSEFRKALQELEA